MSRIIAQCSADMELDTSEMGRTVPSRKKADNSWKKFKSSDVILNPDRRSDADPLYLYRFHIFVCETKRCNSYEWYIGSKDWKDGRKCRKCTVSVMPCETFLGLTPYQGDLRVFGLFRCQKCRRYWKSAYSYANNPQNCETCEIDVYPYKQCYLTWTNNREELQRMEQNRVKGGHQIRLCEVCRSNTAAGGNCLCILRNPQTGFRERHSDGRSSAGTSSSGVSSAENVNDDGEEVIEISLKSIEEAEAEKQKRLRAQKRKMFYNYMRRPPRLQGRTPQSHPDIFTRGHQRRHQSIQLRPRQTLASPPRLLEEPLPQYRLYRRLEETPPPPPVILSPPIHHQRPEMRLNIHPASEMRPIIQQRITEMRPGTHQRPERRPNIQHRPEMRPNIQHRPEMRPNILHRPEMRHTIQQRPEMRPGMQHKRFISTHQAPPQPQQVSRIHNNPTVVLPRAEYSNLDPYSKSQVELLYDKMKLLMI